MPEHTAMTPNLLRPTIICYADILGFESRVMRAFHSGDQEKFLSGIKDSLDRAYGIGSMAAEPDSLDTEIIKIKLFTDNIVVAYPLHDPTGDDGEGELGTVLLLFAYAQASLASDGFLLRGAITEGEHYQDDHIVYGKAFLDAVKLDKSGSAPRLVITTAVESMVSQHLKSYRPGLAPHRHTLLQDPDDGKWFLNYLLAAYEESPYEPIDHELLQKHASQVSKGLQEYGAGTPVGDKFEWIATYHNYVCNHIATMYQAPDDLENFSDELAAWLDTRDALKHMVPLDGRDTKQPPRRFDEEYFRTTIDQSEE